MKPRRPLGAVTSNVPTAKNQQAKTTEMTVEQYLEEQCALIIKDLRLHGADLISKLKEQHNEGVNSIQSIINSNMESVAEEISVTLKCIGGPHLGQKFRLEPPSGATEDVFKMGRSTGRNFKEHGVSLYKDKEISTTHARIEIRNSQVFLIDNRSTNGTQLNNDDVEAQTPYLLKAGDVITMGGTELEVVLSCSKADEEFASV
jgi:hypothetical protein